MGASGLRRLVRQDGEELVLPPVRLAQGLLGSLALPHRQAEGRLRLLRLVTSMKVTTTPAITSEGVRYG